MWATQKELLDAVRTKNGLDATQEEGVSGRPGPTPCPRTGGKGTLFMAGTRYLWQFVCHCWRQRVGQARQTDPPASRCERASRRRRAVTQTFHFIHTGLLFLSTFLPRFCSTFLFPSCGRISDSSEFSHQTLNRSRVFRAIVFRSGVCKFARPHCK